MDFEEQRQLNREAKGIVNIPHPFLKWAGGKRQLLSQIIPLLPSKFNNFIEPFIGGGAVFFYLLPTQGTLIDINPDLINAYQVIKEHPHELIKELQKHKNEKDYYYDVRAWDRDPGAYSQRSAVEKAGRILYMNKCCYNGLYRVNSKGHFNVPFGKYKNPNFCDEENLLAVHKLLQHTNLILGDFEECLKLAHKGDFIYLDPPYHPLTDTANFTSYTKDDFGAPEQERLKTMVDALTQKGCLVMESNSYSPFILELYEGYKQIPVQATRAINSDAKKRGKIKEILIINY